MLTDLIEVGKQQLFPEFDVFENLDTGFSSVFQGVWCVWFFQLSTTHTRKGDLSTALIAPH